MSKREYVGKRASFAIDDYAENEIKYWGSPTTVVCGTVKRDKPLEYSKIQLPIGFPANDAWGKNVVITREAIEHISSSGQYKKLPKLIMDYMPSRAMFDEDGVMYVQELKIIGFHLESDESNCK
jgi:hypothetical protein